MDLRHLFDRLDLNGDGQLTRSELHTAAKLLGWHWREAFLFAFLDLFTVMNPLTKSVFMSCGEEIVNDPQGIYGKVLLRSPLHQRLKLQRNQNRHGCPSYPSPAAPDPALKTINRHNCRREMTDLLSEYGNVESAKAYAALLNGLGTVSLAPHETAMLMIDLQHSFTSGVWMRSTGHRAHLNVTPIRLAFDNCARQLQNQYGKMEIMFTRCPFPPSSYGWDEQVDPILDSKQLYCIKPGNSALFPHTNGCREWIERCIENNKQTLVIGGCTLNSCVRVSAMEIVKRFGGDHLQVMVDLSLCGARIHNYLPSEKFSGGSTVESAIQQMLAEGVQVCEQITLK